MNKKPATSSEKWENVSWKVMNPEWPGFCNKERNNMFMMWQGGEDC